MEDLEEEEIKGVNYFVYVFEKWVNSVIVIKLDCKDLLFIKIGN